MGQQAVVYLDVPNRFRTGVVHVAAAVLSRLPVTHPAAALVPVTEAYQDVTFGPLLILGVAVVHDGQLRPADYYAAADVRRLTEDLRRPQRVQEEIREREELYRKLTEEDARRQTPAAQLEALRNRLAELEAKAKA
jgi:hypothetical protein